MKQPVRSKVIGNTKYFDFNSISHISEKQQCILEAVLDNPSGSSVEHNFFTVVNYTASIQPKISGTVLTSEIEIDNCSEFAKLWRKRTHLIYTKMLNMWEKIIPEPMWVKNKYLILDATNTQLARAVVACTKLEFYQQLMLWESARNNILPFDTGMSNQPYTVNNLLNYEQANTSFSRKLDIDDEVELFPF